MNRPEQQQIDQWFAVADKWIPRKQAKIASGEWKQATYHSLALVHASFARTKFLHGDSIDEVRTEFANTARCILKSFTMAYDEKDPDYQGKKADWIEVAETIAIDGFDFALMAADFSLAEALAGWFRDRPDEMRMDSEVNRYAHALKHALLGGWQQARGFLKTQREAYQAKPSKRRDYRKNYYTLSTALLGILDKNEPLFNEGLRMQLDLYQGDAQGGLKDTDEEFICDYAVALANLGLHHGLAVTVEHQTLPKGLMIQKVRMAQGPLCGPSNCQQPLMSAA